METTTEARENVKIMLAWIDAHNRQDMKALDYMHEDVEIVEVPTGVVYRGMQQMKKLAAMAYSRRGDKEVTNVFASDDEACIEYVARADMSAPLTDTEKKEGLHGIDLSNAKPKSTFELKVCFVCQFKNGKIYRAREYWDAAEMARQFGKSNFLVRVFTFLARLHARRSKT
jgi:ketosteroid isomerase-like protein